MEQHGRACLCSQTWVASLRKPSLHHIASHPNNEAFLPGQSGFAADHQASEIRKPLALFRQSSPTSWDSGILSSSFFLSLASFQGTSEDQCLGEKSHVLFINHQVFRTSGNRPSYGTVFIHTKPKAKCGVPRHSAPS